jgi:hypothetical protein
VTAALAALLASLAACGAAAPGRRAGVSVRPARGGPRTAFVVAFATPVRLGRGATTIRAAAVSARGPARAGCDSSAAAAAVARARAGAGERVALRPRGRWCAGRFRGEVLVLQRPRCRPRRLCPQYVLLLRRVGRFSFRVR